MAYKRLKTRTEKKRYTKRVDTVILSSLATSIAASARELNCSAMAYTRRCYELGHEACQADDTLTEDILDARRSTTQYTHKVDAAVEPAFARELTKAAKSLNCSRMAYVRRCLEIGDKMAETDPEKFEDLEDTRRGK